MGPSHWPAAIPAREGTVERDVGALKKSLLFSNNLDNVERDEIVVLQGGGSGAWPNISTQGHSR